MFLRSSMSSGPQSLTTTSRIKLVSPSIHSHRVYQRRPPVHRLWAVAKTSSPLCVEGKTPNASKITSIQTSLCWGYTLSPSPTQRSSHSPGRTSCSMEWGRKALLDAWSLVLQGREDEVLPMHGVEIDPMTTLGTHPTEPYQHADKQFSTWQMIIFGLRYAFDQIFWRPKDESRMICVPAAYVQSLCNAARANITAANHGENGGDTPFVSQGDVMCAWWTRQTLSCVPKYPSQTIAINIAFGLRWLLAKDMLPASSAYRSCCMVPMGIPDPWIEYSTHGWNTYPWKKVPLHGRIPPVSWAKIHQLHVPFPWIC